MVSLIKEFFLFFFVLLSHGLLEKKWTEEKGLKIPRKRNNNPTCGKSASKPRENVTRTIVRVRQIVQSVI